MRLLKRLAVMTPLLVLAAPAAALAQDRPTLTLGFAKCGHCMPMGLMPELSDKLTIEATNFTSGNDVLTALVSKSIDVAQITYLHYVTALDKGFDVVAISGQVNGGSEIVVQRGLNLKESDWVGFKALVAERTAAGKPLKVAASRGSAQDIHLRGELLLNGINPNKDIQFVNIPNPADHAAALAAGEVEVICTVEPFASQIKLANVGKSFALPYNQAAGKLTNLIVTRSDVIKSRPKDVQETVNAVVKLVDKLNGDQQIWVDVINKYTGLDKAVALAALKNAYPDYKMYRASTLAIVKMMSDLKYIGRDVSADAEKFMDYQFLVEATKMPKSELGY
jgi:ABC-type nitrate/sulfonate/bicarbonate transport system substrate-binding protein